MAIFRPFLHSNIVFFFKEGQILYLFFLKIHFYAFSRDIPQEIFLIVIRAQIIYNTIISINTSQERIPKMVQTKQHKTLRIMAIVLFIAVIAFTLFYCVFAPQPLEGAKTITIQVVDDKQNTTTYETHTDAQYLRQF